MSHDSVKDPATLQAIHTLIAHCGGDSHSFEGALVTELIQTSLRLLFEGHHAGQLKLMTRSLKEMRYAYSVFNHYAGVLRVSIFGSARTPENHPDYEAAKKLGMELASRGWMAITGAAHGIMKAGLEGASRASSFGLSIRLPNEGTTNEIIHGDVKLINFNYFFTRKLMFMSHANALAVFPGGFGTLDELFECLTLLQTGKANLIPIVLVEGVGGNYWEAFQAYIEQNLFDEHWISPEDLSLYYRAPTVADAVAHIERFYRRFHSYRYVKDLIVIRLKKALTEEQLLTLNQEYALLIKEGAMVQQEALQEEQEHRELPRLVFSFTRKNHGLLRRLIDRLNAWE